jgi:hypothetical protein
MRDDTLIPPTLAQVQERVDDVHCRCCPHENPQAASTPVRAQLGAQEFRASAIRAAWVLTRSTSNDISRSLNLQ